jgi:magnesium-transporting ATPase (P-type)
MSSLETTQAVPTSQAPTSQAPTTQAPTTQAPTTQAPTTQAPVPQDSEKKTKINILQIVLIIIIVLIIVLIIIGGIFSKKSYKAAFIIGGLLIVMVVSSYVIYAEAGKYKYSVDKAEYLPENAQKALVYIFMSISLLAISLFFYRGKELLELLKKPQLGEIAQGLNLNRVV